MVEFLLTTKSTRVFVDQFDGFFDQRRERDAITPTKVNH